MSNPLSANRAAKRILVLGATSGIAEATCRIWARQGANFVLVARNESNLNAVAGNLKALGAASVEMAVVDLDNTEYHSALIAHATTALGGLDIALLAYGVLGDQSEAEQQFGVAEKILHTNFIAPVSLLTELANYCVQAHSGSLVVLSSVAGDRGRKSNYVYGSSKAGLTAFLAGLRNRVDREGVHVLTIKPGPTYTPMTAGMKGSESFARPEKVAQAIVAAVEKRKDTLYVPLKWLPIMTVIRHIPESIFKKLNL
jgi:short-subunit dehydrogenase